MRKTIQAAFFMILPPFNNILYTTMNTIYKKILLAVIFLCLQTTVALAGVLVLNGLTHIHEVAEGKSYRGHILLKNTGNTNQDVKIYQRDYSFNYKGEVHYPAPATYQRSNAEWIKLNANYITLLPNEEKKIPYELVVPTGEELVGSYWSVIMLEGVVQNKDITSKELMEIKTVLRYAIQIAANVQNSGDRKLQFVNVAPVQGVDSLLHVDIDIENIGEVLLIPEISMELFDEEGISVGILKADKKKVYPGTSVRFSINLNGTEPGKYQSLILADCGQEDIFGINLEIDTALTKSLSKNLSN